MAMFTEHLGKAPRAPVCQPDAGGRILMAMWIIAGMLASMAFGFSMLPVLVIGALCMCGLTYYLTHDSRNARLGVGMAIVLFNYGLVTAVQRTPGLVSFEIPSWASWLASDTFLAVVACVVIVASMVLGMFGSTGRLPLDMRAVVEKVKSRHDADDDTIDQP
jgi:hypothetical protein